MTIRIHGLGVLAAVAAATIAVPAAALQINEGDVVAVFQKSGIEVIVNLGEPEIGATVDLSGLFDAFGNSLADAKFVALAVPDVDKSVVLGGTPATLHNLMYTTLVEDPLPEDGQIEGAMGITDIGPGANTWFNLLRQLSGTDTVEISTSDQFSYEAYLGVGTDRIAGYFPFSVAGFFDDDGHLEIPLFYAQRGYAGFGGPAASHYAVALLVVDESLEQAKFEEAPEASAVAGTLAGSLVLAVLAARRRTAAA